MTLLPEEKREEEGRTQRDAPDLITERSRHYHVRRRTNDGLR